jgi:hypothetical protein
MLAPPTREQWYLLASPFLPEGDGTKPPICWRNWKLCLDGKWPIILLRGPLGAWGSLMCSKFTTRDKQLKVPPGGLVPLCLILKTDKWFPIIAVTGRRVYIKHCGQNSILVQNNYNSYTNWTLSNLYNFYRQRNVFILNIFHYMFEPQKVIIRCYKLCTELLNCKVYIYICIHVLLNLVSGLLI